MYPNHIDHIGIAVKNLSESIPKYELLLGTKCYKTEIVHNQNVKTAFFKVGQTKIELLEAMNEESPIYTHIKNKGEGIHHIAFSVENADESLAGAKANGFRLIDASSRQGADDMRIGFLNPRNTNGVLIELCSKM